MGAFEFAKFLPLLALSVHDVVFGAVWPLIVTFAVLLALFPSADKYFAIRIVQCSLARTLVVSELALVDLTTWPVVDTLAIFSARVEITKENASVWPLEQSLALHSVVTKRTLVNFPVSCDATTPYIYLPFGEVALENGVVRVNLEPVTIGLVVSIGLSSEHSARLSSVKIKPQSPLHCLITCW